MANLINFVTLLNGKFDKIFIKTCEVTNYEGKNSCDRRRNVNQ